MEIVKDPSAILAQDRSSVQAVVLIKKRQGRNKGQGDRRDRRRRSDASPVDTVTLSGTGPRRETDTP